MSYRIMSHNVEFYIHTKLFWKYANYTTDQFSCFAINYVLWFMKRSIFLTETPLGFGEVKACFEQLLKYEIRTCIRVRPVGVKNDCCPIIWLVSGRNNLWLIGYSGGGLRDKGPMTHFIEYELEIRLFYLLKFFCWV